MNPFAAQSELICRKKRPVPDPKSLKVGHLIRFVAGPEEWSQPSVRIQAEDSRFMRQMICRRWPSLVYKVDADGYPWIRAIIRERGRRYYHYWMITESTGWLQVNRRVGSY